MNPFQPPEDPDGDVPASAARPADAPADAARAGRMHRRGTARPDEARSDPARRAPTSHAPPQRGAWFQRLPAKLAATVVFLVALTTLLGNLLELREKGRSVIAPDAARSSAVAENAAPVAAAPTGPARTRISLERIAVQADGSPGTTDWRFTVEADGQPLFAFEQGDLDDSGGRNVVRPEDAGAALRLAPGHRPRLSVKGWRLSRFRMQGAPDAVGEGSIVPGGGEAAIRVAADEASGGAFVFYFSADVQ